MNIVDIVKKLDRIDIILILLLAASFLLRIYKIDKIPPSLYIDEIWNTYDYYLYNSGLKDIIWRHSSLLHLEGVSFVYLLFGPSIIFSRLPMVIFGTIIVFLTYILGKELYSKEVGLISAILISVAPWSFNLSRYSIPSIPYLFYFMTGLILILRSNSATTQHSRNMHIILGMFVLGLTLNTHIMAVPFITIFMIGYIILNFGYLKNISSKIQCCGAFLLGSLPTIYNYILGFGQKKGIEATFGSYSTFPNSMSDIPRFVTDMLGRIYLHLSPDFLVLNSGLSYIDKYRPGPPYSSRIMIDTLLRYSTGTVGVLNYWGILFYPALIYIIYKVIFDRQKSHNKLLIWWVLAYAITSGVAYFGNPNAARNIIGLPAFVIIIAIFMDNTSKICASKVGIFSNKKNVLTSILIIFVVLLPTVSYLNYYFNEYPIASGEYFNYGQKSVADYLTDRNLWNSVIYIRTYEPDWYNDQILSFYSPIQPNKGIHGVWSDQKDPDGWVNFWIDQERFNISNSQEKDVLFVTPFLDDVYLLNQINYNVIGRVYNLDNTLAFVILKLDKEYHTLNGSDRTNLVRNPSFENVTKNNLPIYWKFASSAFNSSLDRSTKMSGNYSYMLTTMSKIEVYSQVFSSDIDVKENETYLVRTHVKGENVKSAHIKVDAYYAKKNFWDESFYFIPGYIDGTFGWEEYYTFIKIPEGVTKIRLVLQAGYVEDKNAGNATTWFDDVEFIDYKR